MKIKELFSDRSKWTKGAFARSLSSSEVTSSSSAAVCWCLEGAVNKCYDDYGYRLPVLDKIEKVIKCPVTVWNDQPERTFEEVKKLVEELDI